MRSSDSARRDEPSDNEGAQESAVRARDTAIVRGISECIGIETVVSKVIGPRGTLAQVYSTFHALSQVTTPHEESLRRGRRIVRVSRWDDKI
jgi:hypothetical protein